MTKHIGTERALDLCVLFRHRLDRMIIDDVRFETALHLRNGQVLFHLDKQICLRHPVTWWSIVCRIFRTRILAGPGEHISCELGNLVIGTVITVFNYLPFNDCSCLNFLPHSPHSKSLRPSCTFRMCRFKFPAKWFLLRILMK